MMSGSCLCGAIHIEVARAATEISACHCATCRRWSGAATWGFAAPEAAVNIQGEPRRYRSSAFAHRAFCAECGTHLWLRDDGSTEYEFCPGLFDDLARTSLNREVYSDRAFASVTLSGDHHRIGQAEHERDNRSEP